MHSENVGVFRANRTEKVGACIRANKTQKGVGVGGGALPRHIPLLLYYGSTPPPGGAPSSNA